jgi:hypothetical protein
MAERPARRAPPARALLLALAGALLAPRAARGKSPAQAAACASSPRHLATSQGLRECHSHRESKRTQGASEDPPGSRSQSLDTGPPPGAHSGGWVGVAREKKTLCLGALRQLMSE